MQCFVDVIVAGAAAATCRVSASLELAHVLSQDCLAFRHGQLDIQNLTLALLPFERVAVVAMLALRLERLPGIDQNTVGVRKVGLPPRLGQFVLVPDLPQVFGALRSADRSVIGDDFRKLLHARAGALPLDVAFRRLRLCIKQICFRIGYARPSPRSRGNAGWLPSASRSRKRSRQD